MKKQWFDVLAGGVKQRRASDTVEFDPELDGEDFDVYARDDDDEENEYYDDDDDDDDD
ncbi:MAG: hypothetical protein HUK22_08600, partial [Thermoguttaceae bacterium]|nr:hypothetical protein [Thermoguttaceae bacterium]